MEERTAIDWFFDNIKSHFEHDGDLLETLMFSKAIAKKKEREQHGRTWDAAIDAYEKRGVKSRAWTDFDEYEIQ